MNILLTEIRSLNLELSGLPEVAPDTASSFARLFQQQLPENSEFVRQVIDYNELYAEFEVPAGAPAETLEMPQAKAWRDYLAQDPMRISSDSNPLQTTPVNLEPIALPAAAQAPRPAAMAQSPIGELLPRGGKSLPDAGLAPPVPEPGKLQPGRVIHAPAQVQPGMIVNPPAQVQPGIAVSPPVQAPNSQTMAAGVNFQVPTGSPDPAAELKAQITRPSTIPANPDADSRTPVLPNAIEKAVIPAAAAAVPQAKSAPVAVARIATEARSLPSAELRQPSVPKGGPAIPAVQAEPVADTWSAAARFATLSKSATTLDPGPLEQRIPVNPEAPVARVPAPAESLAERAGINPERLPAAARAAAEVQPARPAAAAAETTAAGELRENPRIQLTQPPQPLENNPPQNAPVRAAEPVPNVTAPPAPAAGAPAPVAATPLTVAQAAPAAGEVLPPQLEVLQLSRQANGNDWGNGIGERVQWMINQKQNSAMIRLDPPALGKLDVQVKIAEDSTTITIQTQHAQTRDLIETASHRLRDFLQESGYQNVNVDVSQRQDQQQARAQTAAGSGDDSNRDADAEQDIDDSTMQQGHAYQGDGLLDTFA